MYLESQNHEDDCDYDEKNLGDFAEMMKRWGVVLPEQPAEPLGIEMLMEGWCKARFDRPMAAIRELEDGTRHIEAAGALFAYCYSVLSPSFFGWTLEQCLQWDREQIELEPMRESSRSDQKTTRAVLEHYHHDVIACQDLMDFAAAHSAGRLMYPDDQHETASSSYVRVLLTAAHALISLSGENSQYDPYVCGDLERAFDIIRQGKVQQAQRFSSLDFDDKGRELSGDVEGFLACLGCAVVCYSLAWMKSELSPENERDYETVFMAYVSGAKYMCRTRYSIDFFSELFASEPEKGEGGPEIYWKATTAWAEVIKRPESVRNWRELRVWLMNLKDVMYREDHDEDIGLYPVDEPGFVYLPRQISFCDGRLSQQEIAQLMDQQKRNQQEQRLQNDFFDGLWQYLEETTRDCIIKAEHTWYDNPTKESRKAAFVDYSNALEIELRAIIFGSPGVRSWVAGLIKKIRQGQRDERYPALTSKKADSLYLSDMSKLLKQVRDNQANSAIPPIDLPIFSLPIPENIERERHLKAFLTEEAFTEDLSDIYQIRNIAAHALRDRRVLGRLNELRRRILGIGSDGYLMKLAEIKRLISSAA